MRGKQRRHLREQLLEQAVFAQQLVGGQAIASQEQLEGFLEQAGCRNILQQRCQLLDGGGSARADGHVQLGGEAHGAQHPHRIFAVAGLGSPMSSSLRSARSSSPPSKSCRVKSLAL